ncbi:hypothetical protein BGZ72_005696 [Mortierella alpina]|nr:hypothetical protein BGZ72_005696 [Mortierella alpina]
MAKTQSFRIAGSTADIENIDVDSINGLNVIYWEDIEQVFPGVRLIRNGSSVVKLLRDSNRERITPHCIQHYPDVVLDVVVLSSAVDHVQVDSPAATQSQVSTSTQANALADTLGPNYPGSPSADPSIIVQPGSQSDSCNDGQISPLGTGATVDAVLAQGSGASSTPTVNGVVSGLAIAEVAPPVDLSSTEQCQGFQGAVMHKLDGLYDQGALTQKIAQDVLKLQKQMNDRLILIQSKTEAILTQQLELAEYPIPRLFIVLPEEPAKYDPGNWFRTKFRLHFICECGKHTEASNNKVPHHLHLAKHEGYLVREPTEFFKNYGPFLLLMLELIKFGTSVAGHVVPTLASLKVIELADSVKQSVEQVTAKIDYSLKCIDKQLAKIQELSPGDLTDTERRESMTHEDLTNYLNDVEGLEGVELRQLGSFLKISEDESLLGNLYRMTTPDGHVKWVCRDHYRAGYQEKFVQKLREIVASSGGEFDEQQGRIKITLESSIAATEFYEAITKAKGVLDLNLELHWNQGYDDLVKLRDMMRKSNIRSIALHLHHMTGPIFDIKLSTRRRYDPIVEIMRLPTLQSFGMDGTPKDFFKRSSAWARANSFSNLRHLTIGWVDPSEDTAKFSLLVAQAPGLSYLSLASKLEKLPAVFSSIAKYQTYLIDFRNLSMRFVPPQSNSRISNVALQNLPQLFKAHGAQVEALDFRQIALNELVTEALVEATQAGSSLKVLSLDGSDGCLSDKCSGDLASIVSRSELHTFRIKLDDADRHVRILRAIQWVHIRRLEIRETQHSREMAMKALVDGMERLRCIHSSAGANATYAVTAVAQAS